MPNPLFGNNISPNGATAPNDSLNDSYKRYRRGYNRFNLTRQFYNTERYADINLIEVLEGVEGDVLPFGSKHEIRSHTMKSPVMFNLYKKKTYFMVDNQAILPINWKRVYKQPNKGDDVNYDVNCVSNFLYDINYFLTNVRLGIFDFSATRTANTYNYLWRVVLLLESIFSDGSLLSSMNCHLSPSLIVLDENGERTNKSFDAALDELYATFVGARLTVKFPSISDEYFSNESTSHHYLELRTIIDMMRTFPDFVLSYSESTQGGSLDRLIKFLGSLIFNFDNASAEEENVINLSRPVAYQLVCNQFYTRDSVDNVYTAPDYIDNAKSTIKSIVNDVHGWPKFSYNGTDYEYDVFSGHIIDKVFNNFFSLYPSGDSDYDSVKNSYYYFHMIFFFRKSLRYGDYFVGAKTLPYAPADVTADVVGNGVSALDITRSILMQRFANAVERVSNTWKDYLSGVTDGVAPPTPFEPRFLASSTSSVSGFEVENTTSENQGNIVTILKSHNSNYVYELKVGEPCIIIGVSTYEVPRVYSRTVSRFFRHKDRFDMFNKFMQNVGDQEITLNERNSSFSPTRIFGYTPRHMEYKQRYPIASGGFIENLPGYAFITDNAQSGQNELDFADYGLRISPYYIRNRNSEFDRFYSSLTGLTLASYFHFICKYDCICNASRQMEYSPSIL